MPVRLYGATSGYVDIKVPDVADNGTVTLSPNLMSPGLVLIRKESFSGATSVSLDNVFTSTYKNYRIVLSGTGSTGLSVNMRLRASGSDASGGNYTRQYSGSDGGSGFASRSSGNTSWIDVTAFNTNESFANIEVYAPQLSGATVFKCEAARTESDGYVWTTVGRHSVSASYDGFTLIPSTGTFTGTVYVYGYAETVGDYPQLNQLPGMQLVTTQPFTAASAVSVDNCFTSQYDDYRVSVVCSGTLGTPTYVALRTRTSGTDYSGATHVYSGYYNTVGGGPSRTFQTGQTYALLGHVGDLTGNMAVDFYSPAIAGKQNVLFTNSYGGGATDLFTGTWSTYFGQSAACDGFTIYPGSSTFSGVVSVYGYRKA